MSDLYRVRRPPRQEILRLGKLNTHLTLWGPEPSQRNPPVFLLHGWQDTGDTFQFMVDSFECDWPLVALDWRGFGRSEWASDGYWFPDYLADLDTLLDILSPDAPARLVGHSMGGNIASQYAGVRPERVRCLANLEGFGLPRTRSGEAPARLRKWLDQVKSIPTLKEYESFEQLATIIRYRYPRFSDEQATFVAHAWAREDEHGRVRLLGDPRHRWLNPVLYKRDDAEACWLAIVAPLLLLIGEESELLSKLGADGTDAALRHLMPHAEFASIAAAGHMLHIEQPEAVARRIETFLSSH